MTVLKSSLGNSLSKGLWKSSFRYEVIIVFQSRKLGRGSLAAFSHEFPFPSPDLNCNMNLLSTIPLPANFKDDWNPFQRVWLECWNVEVGVKIDTKTRKMWKVKFPFHRYLRYFNPLFSLSLFLETSNFKLSFATFFRQILTANHW